MEYTSWPAYRLNLVWDYISLLILLIQQHAQKLFYFPSTSVHKPRSILHTLVALKMENYAGFPIKFKVDLWIQQNTMCLYNKLVSNKENDLFFYPPHNFLILEWVIKYTYLSDI